MAANINPIFIRQGQVDIGTGYLTTANTTADLTSGTSLLCFTADATEGSFLQYIKCKSSPAGNNVQTVARVWINNGATTGTAAHFRIKKSGTCHIQGSVGVGSGDLQVDSVSFTAGQAFSITAFTMTDGNG